jgi:hypothetical protein
MMMQKITTITVMNLRKFPAPNFLGRLLLRNSCWLIQYFVVWTYADDVQAQTEASSSSANQNQPGEL